MIDIVLRSATQRGRALLHALFADLGGISPSGESCRVADDRATAFAEDLDLLIQLTIFGDLDAPRDHDVVYLRDEHGDETAVPRRPAETDEVERLLLSPHETGALGSRRSPQPCPLLSGPHPAPPEEPRSGPRGDVIHSAGYELQSSDLFLALVEYLPEGDGFVCTYASNLGARGDQTFLVKQEGPLTISVSLDAIPPSVTAEDQMRDMLNEIEGVTTTVLTDAGPRPLAIVDCETPQDTEFDVLNLSRDSVLHTQPDRNAVDPVIALADNYAIARASLVHFHLNRIGRISFISHTDHEPPARKHHTMWLEQPLPRTPNRLQLAYIANGFSPQDSRRISFAPQATFSCALADAYSVLRRLMAATAANPPLGVARNAADYVRGLCAPARGAERSFLFLLLLYLHVMAVGSKQELAIALRHGFDEALSLLNEGDRRALGRATRGALPAVLHAARTLVANDDIGRRARPGGELVLIEYRVFAYMVNAEGHDILQL